MRKKIFVVYRNPLFNVTYGVDLILVGLAVSLSRFLLFTANETLMQAVAIPPRGLRFLHLLKLAWKTTAGLFPTRSRQWQVTADVSQRNSHPQLGMVELRS